MKYVFDAIRERFDGDTTIKAACRLLFDGLNFDVVRKPLPCVYQNVDAGRRLDTFDSDGMEYDLRFELFSNSKRSDEVTDMILEWGRVFDYCDLNFAGGDWYCIDLQYVDQDGPVLVDEIWRGTMFYRLRLGRMNTVPLLRLP